MALVHELRPGTGSILGRVVADSNLARGGPVLGRRTERAALDRLLEEARLGQSGALVLRGLLRSAGPTLLRQHWPGPAALLVPLERFAAAAPAPGGAWRRPR